MSPGPAASASNSIDNNRQDSLGRSVLVRAIIGILLLFLFVSGSAWLMNAGIQAEAETAEDTAAISEPVDRPR
jgi:hypothetical protein|nr:MAG: hypothetical protein DIU57_00990 [Pseudomonadota bacterium]